MEIPPDLPADPFSALPDAKARWDLRHICDLAETATSQLWRADSPVHGPVVLKILKPYGADEIHGVHLMQALDGQGMARLFGHHNGAILMEDLGGEMLGDLVRQGQDGEACLILADIALHIRRAPTAGLVPLRRHLRALLDSADFPQERALAETQLDSAPITALHGDLHHDNILRGAQGWRAIDAKGLAGDPAYEFANVFRNPFDCQPLARQPARILALATTFAATCNTAPERILGWGRIHIATSMLWDRAAGNPTSDDEALFPVLSSLHQQV